MFYHFSEDPNITVFNPRVAASYPDLPPLVWAIDKEHAPLYFFPRDCPRIAFWKGQESSRRDCERFISYSQADMIIAVEARWLETIKRTKLYQYSFAPESFSLFDENAGYYTATTTVQPITVEPVGDLLNRLIQANVEIRITPSLKPLSDVIKNTRLNFSMIRMRNAQV